MHGFGEPSDSVLRFSFFFPFSATLRKLRPSAFVLSGFFAADSR